MVGARAERERPRRVASLQEASACPAGNIPAHVVGGIPHRRGPLLCGRSAAVDHAALLARSDGERRTGRCHELPRHARAHPPALTLPSSRHVLGYEQPHMIRPRTRLTQDDRGQDQAARDGRSRRVTDLRLQTDRLELRALTVGDLDELASMLADAEALTYWGPPLSRGESRSRIERNLKRYEKDGFGRCAVVLRATGEFVGDCGLICTLVEGRPEVELGWIVRRSHQGKGNRHGGSGGVEGLRLRHAATGADRVDGEREERRVSPSRGETGNDGR